MAPLFDCVPMTAFRSHSKRMHSLCPFAALRIQRDLSIVPFSIRTTIEQQANADAMTVFSCKYQCRVTINNRFLINILTNIFSSNRAHLVCPFPAARIKAV